MGADEFTHAGLTLTGTPALGTLLTLFSVVAIALLASWFISMKVTPLQCMLMLPDPAPGSADEEPYASNFYQRFRSLVGAAIRLRWLTLGSMAALLVIALLGFGNVSSIFFPDSSMTKFMVDYWAPEGTRIQEVSEAMRVLERGLMDDPRVAAVSSRATGSVNAAMQASVIAP